MLKLTWKNRKLEYIMHQTVQTSNSAYLVPRALHGKAKKPLQWVGFWKKFCKHVIPGFSVHTTENTNWVKEAVQQVDLQ